MSETSSSGAVAGQRLPRRGDDRPPDWWVPYKDEFPRWRAWRGVRQFWVRLPGTMRVYHADDPAGLAGQIRAADADETRDARGRLGLLRDKS